MKRAPLLMRAAGGLLALTALLAAAPPGGAPPPADVTAVSLLPTPGRAELVIDVRGVVEVSDFVLRNPDRLVVDLVGARLVAPLIQYDGVDRAGIRNVRYSQFRPDVVRVVVELNEARDYEIRQEESAVRVGFEAAQSFNPWSSDGARLTALAPASAAAPRAPADRGALPAAIPPAAAVAPASRQAPQQPRISVTFDRASIQEVVANFASFSGRSIVLGAGVAGEVTAEIRDQPWDVAFNAILARQQLTASELPGGIIIVDTRANLAVQDSTEPLTTRIVKINYARAVSLQPSVAGITTPGRGRVVADTTTNSIIVTDLRSRIDTVESFVRMLDQRTPQVAIQARIIFVERTALEGLGIQYDIGQQDQFFNVLARRVDASGTPIPGDAVIHIGGEAMAAVANASEALKGSATLRVIATTVMGNFSLTAFLSALQSVGLSDVQAEPSVTVADNRVADILVGERTPIRMVDVASGTGGGGGSVARATTQMQETGIKLRATPHVVAGTREILLELHAERSALQASTISEIGAIFATQEANTQLLVQDGETAVIAGLTVTDVTISRTGIPILVDLPIVGRLFGFRSSTEVRRDLLILVTPHIVDDLSTTGAGETDRR